MMTQAQHTKAVVQWCSLSSCSEKNAQILLENIFDEASIASTPLQILPNEYREMFKNNCGTPETGCFGMY